MKLRFAKIKPRGKSESVVVFPHINQGIITTHLFYKQLHFRG